MIRNFSIILFIILLLNTINKVYFQQDINIFSILLNFDLSNLYVCLSIFFLLYLIIKFFKHYLIQKLQAIRYKTLKNKRKKFFEKNIFSNKLTAVKTNNNLFELKNFFFFANKEYINRDKISILNKNFFINKENLVKKFLFLKVLSNDVVNVEPKIIKKYSLLNIISKFDFKNLNSNESILSFLNNDSFLIKKRKQNYYNLLLVHFLILKLQKKELINSLNLQKKIGNYPFTLAYDEEVISFRRSKYFDYTSTELFFLLLYGLLEWCLVFYLIHLGFCIFYDINVFEIFFKMFENFLPYHFQAYSNYLKISMILNSIFFFFLLVYTLTDWVFELTDEVSTYQLPPKDWFVDVFLPSLQGMLLVIITSVIFFLFVYNGYVFIMIILYNPLEYFYNFTIGSVINIENLVILFTLFDINTFLKLFFLDYPGIIFNFYSPFFQKTGIFYRVLFDENFLWNYSSIFSSYNQKNLRTKFYFFSIEYQNLLELKIWKNELLFDLRKYNYFLQQENDILIINHYINKGFRGLGLRLDNQYFFKNIDFISKNNLRHFRPNSETLLDSILTTKYDQSYKNNDIIFLNLSIFPEEKKFMNIDFFDFNAFNDTAFDVIYKQNNFFKKSINNYIIKFISFFFNNNLLSYNNLQLYPLDINDSLNYKINSKFLYNDLIYENLSYINNADNFKIPNNYIINGEFLPFVFPEDQRDLLLLNLKLLNLPINKYNNIQDLKEYISKTLILGDFINNKIVTKNYLNNKQIADLSSKYDYSPIFYNFLKNLINNEKNLTSLILLNIEFLQKKQQDFYKDDVYKDEIAFLMKLIQNNNQIKNQNLNFSKIIIKDDFIYPFFNTFFKPFYFIRNIDSLSFMPRISSTNNSIYFHDEDENIQYWWDNFLIVKRLFKFYANFPSVFLFSNRKNIIYLRNFGEKIYFRNQKFTNLNDNINEIQFQNFSSYYNMEIKFQNFAYFQNTLWDRYFHKFYDSTFITKKREVSLVEYNDIYKNKISFMPHFEKINKRFFQPIFNINWKKSKDKWLENPQQNYINPYVQYSKHLLNFPEYYKLEIDFSQAILDYETTNLLEGYRTPLTFSAFKKDEDNKSFVDSDSGFVIDRDLLRTYQFGDYVGLLLLKDYQTTLLFDKKNFLLNNFLYNLYLDKLYIFFYNLNNNKYTQLNKYFNTYLLFPNFSFLNFYETTFEFKFYNQKLNFFETLIFSDFTKNVNKKKQQKYIKLFIPYLDKENVYFVKYFVNYFNIFSKQEELNGIFERINIKLADFIDRLLLKKKLLNSSDFLTNYFIFLNLKNYLKIRGIDPWELYLINKNQNIYDSLIYKTKFLFDDVPYDEILENSRNKLRNLQKLTYILTPYRLNYRGFRKFGILRHDLKLRNFNTIISFYLDKQNYVNFGLKLINIKLQQQLSNIMLERYKNKVHKDLLHELSYELGIGSHLGRKANHKKMDYRILHFTNSRHLLLKSKLFCEIFYNNKIDPYIFNMYNFPFDNEFSKIWSKAFHNILLSNQIFEKINIDKIFGKEVINNQIRYKRIFLLKFFTILNNLHIQSEKDYYNDLKKKFNIIFEIDTNPFLYLKSEKRVSFKKFNNLFFDKTLYNIDSINFQTYFNNKKNKLNEFDFLLILKDYIPLFFDFFYTNISTPYYDWFVNDEWISKRFRKYGFRLFKTYRTFYFKDERFPLDYFSRKKMKRLQDFQILEKVQAKRRKLKKKRFIYHNHKLLIYKYIPAVRAKIPKTFRVKSRWVFVINKIKPIPLLLIFKNNDIRSNKIRSYLFFLQNLGNFVNFKSGSLFWPYFLNNRNNNLFFEKINKNFNFKKSFYYKDIGKFLVFEKNGFLNFFFSRSSIFKSYLRFSFINDHNRYYFQNSTIYIKNFKLFDYNYVDHNVNFTEKKMNQYKYLSRFLLFNNRNYNFLNFYTPKEYFLYNKAKWNSWLNLNKYRKIEEHYIQYNLSQDKTFSANVNDGNDFNIKEIEERESRDQPYFLSNPAVIVPQIDLSDDLPFRLENPKKYYIPYVHENWYYNNLKANYPVNNKSFKFYSFYYDIYNQIRQQTFNVLKKKIQFDFFQIQKVYYFNNLLYKYNYNKKDVDFYYFYKHGFLKNYAYFLNFFSNFIKYQLIYINNLLYVNFLFYFLFLKKLPIIGDNLIILLNFFFSFYIFFYNLFINLLFPFLNNFFEIIYIDFIKFFLIAKKLYFHPFWIFILYFLWILYYYVLARVFTNSKEIYDFKNLAAQLDWDEETYDFDLVRRKFDTKSFFELVRPSNNVFLKNAIEFQERDKTPTLAELEKLNIFSYHQKFINRNSFYKQRVLPFWFTKIYPNYENTKNESFELNFTRQSNAFVYNYFIKPIYRLYLNTNYVSKTNFIYKNNNTEKLVLKYYVDTLLKNFARHGSDTSEFGRFRWLYIATVFFFQFLLFVFIIAFIVFLLF